MNKYLRQFFSLFILTIFIGYLIGCSCCKHELCCIKYTENNELATYCNNHRDAVVKFIRIAEDVSEQKVRLNDFKQFYKSIKKCSTVECIETQIDMNNTLPGFKAEYEAEHNFAERDTQVDESLKAELILCGFKHAIVAQKQTLNNDSE